MAQPIYCDAEACAQLASTMTTNLATGETVAYCDQHYVEFVVGTANAVMEEYQRQHPEAATSGDGAVATLPTEAQTAGDAEAEVAETDAPEGGLPSEAPQKPQEATDADDGGR